MAMRRGGGAGPRRGGARSGLVQPVYEDFKPVSEWQQDDESHFLNVYLPGFMKEQIKVSTEGKNTIRVQGERLVAGNKWNRFKEDFQVPENGEMNSVRAKFQGGILTMTVPKEKVAKTESINDIKSGRGKDASITKTTDDKSTEPKKPSIKQGEDGDSKKPITKMSQEKDIPAVGTSKPTVVEKILEPKKMTSSDTKEHDQDGDRGRSFTPLKKPLVSNDIVKNEDFKSTEKQSATATQENARKLIGHKELPDVETKVEKDRAGEILQKNADKKELHEASTKEKYKKKVKGLTDLNEERQLLVNMGSAMLVIVSLTAYITYSFVSAKNKN